MNQGVGEAGAVHVQLQAVAAAGCGERGDFAGRVDRAPFGGLGDADGFRQHVVHAAIARRGP